MPFSVALGLQSHSPLKRNMDWAVTWVVESGLVDYWFLQSLRQYKMVGLHLLLACMRERERNTCCNCEFST